MPRKQCLYSRLDLCICCPNLGCEYECAKSKMTEHLVKCEFKTIPCLDPNCEKDTMPLKGLVEHLKATHDATQMVCKDGAVAIPCLHSAMTNVRILHPNSLNCESNGQW